MRSYTRGRKGNIKKSQRLLCSGNEISYTLIGELKKAYPVTQLCKALDVSKSSYYYWQSHRELTAERLNLQCQVKAIHAESNQTYGSRRMSDALREKGLDIGRHQARSLMQESDVVVIYPKKRHVYPAHSGEVSRIADNHLNREFEASRPNEKWVGDITYLWTAAGWLYLAVVLDLFSKKVMGWCLSASPDTDLVLAALNQAATLRQITPTTGILFHSDQGCQYTSHAYQDRLSELHIMASMSRKGNCWDTQYKISLNVRPNLTRAGIGVIAFVLTCRLATGVLRSSPDLLLVT